VDHRTVIETPDHEMVQILRGKSPAERLEIAFGMWRSARGMIEAVLRQQHPEWSSSGISDEVARRLSHGPI